MKFFTLFVVGAWALGARADAVRLQIVGPDGKPVAGALVRVVESSGSWQERKAETPLELTGDENGKVAFESKNSLVEPTKPQRFGPSNVVYARVIAPGMAIAAQDLKAGDNEIKLQAGQTWGGIALDDDQKPVANAKIVLNGFGAEGEAKAVYFPKGLQLETPTGADGKWSLGNLPRGGSARVVVINPRFVREALELPLSAMGAPPLFLERGASIKGRLLTPDGQPAADVPLYPGESGNDGFGFNDFRTAADARLSYPACVLAICICNISAAGASRCLLSSSRKALSRSKPEKSATSASGKPKAAFW